MFTKILLMFAGVAVSVVTANPLLQAIVTQNCPICEQNSLKSQLQNLLLQSIQPYAQAYFNPSPPPPVQPVLSVEQPFSLCPTQNRQNQNFQGPCQQVQPQCSQTLKSQNNHDVSEAVNKLLSNPNFRTILDPNTKLFNQNGVEVPRNRPCNAGTPSIVNNYIIVPTEFLLEDNIRNSKRNEKIPEERGVKNRTNNSDRKTTEGGKVDSEVTSNNTGLIENSPDNGKRKQRRRQRNRNPDIKVKVVQGNTTQESNQIEPPQRQTKILKEQNKEIPTANTSNKEATTIPIPSVNLTNKIEDEKENKNLNNIFTEPNQPSTNKDENSVQKQAQISPIEKQNSHNKDIQVKNVIETLTVKPNTYKNIAKTKHKKSAPRHFNAREEAVIKDFRHKFPNIPEDVVRNLLNHLKRQLQQQNFDAPAFYYPQFPLSYDQLFRNQYSQTPTIVVNTQSKKSRSSAQKPVVADQKLTNNTTNKSAKRKKNRQNKNQQQAPSKLTTPETYTTTESTPITVLATPDKNYMDTTTIPTTNTQMPPTAKVAIETPDIANAAENKQTDHIDNTNFKIIQESKPSNVDKENEIDVNVPESGSKYVAPKLYIHEFEDEYYPDFTGDHQYNSDEDYSFIILEDDRFHYTTDKNVQLEELNRERRRFDTNSRKNTKRPEGRYLLRLKNKDSSKAVGRHKISENTSSRPLIKNIDIPRIFVKLKTKDSIKSMANKDTDFDERDIKEPMTSSNDERTQFRTPPTLEKIDFETKQINKKHYSYDDFETKTSSYSDLKTPQYNFNKYSDKSKYVDDNPKPPTGRIETVYANSKVANYGKSSSNEVLTEKNIWMDIDNEYSRIENDGRKVVFAKTIDGDFW